MKDLISYIARALVDFPDEVEVGEVEGRHTTVLELRVAKKDMGKIIGRSGATAKAIRTLLRVVGMKNDARVNLKINEPEGGMRAGGATMADANAEPTEAPAAEPQRERSVDEVLADLEG